MADVLRLKFERGVMADRLLIFLTVFIVSQQAPSVAAVLPIIALELLNNDKSKDKVKSP